jgi:hypothetical protein
MTSFGRKHCIKRRSLENGKAIQVQDLILVISTPGRASVSAHRKGETFGLPGPSPGGGGMERARLSKDAELLAEVTRPLGGERG